MIPLVLAVFLQGDVADLVRRAAAEEDKDKRSAIVAQLRKVDFAAIEKALRTPSRGPARTILPAATASALRRSPYMMSRTLGAARAVPVSALHRFRGIGEERRVSGSKCWG